MLLISFQKITLIVKLATNGSHTPMISWFNPNHTDGVFQPKKLLAFLRHPGTVQTTKGIRGYLCDP